DQVHVKFVGVAAPQVLVTARQRRAERLDVDEILERGATGGRIDLAEGLYVYETASLMRLGEAADRRRAALHGDGVVTYIVDRNVNYTSYCVTRCKCWNCSVPPAAKTGRGYGLRKDELAQTFSETEALGGIQILLQGGLSPALDLAWYEDLFR